MQIGLHEIDTLALGGVAILVDLTAFDTVRVHEVDTSDAAAVLARYVNVVLNAATADQGLEHSVGISWILHEKTVVSTDSQGRAVE